jgi:hypothetical protein
VRRVVWTGLALSILLGVYCGIWWYLSEQSRSMIVAWMEGIPADRTTIATGEMRRGGFPFTVRWTLTDPRVDAQWALGEVSTQASSLALWLKILEPSKVRFEAAKPVSVASRASGDRAWRLKMASISGTIEQDGSGAFDIQYAAEGLLLDRIGPRDSATPTRRVGEALAARGSARMAIGPVAPDPPPAHSATLALDAIKIPGSGSLLASETGSALLRLTLRGGMGDGSIEDLVTWRDESGVVEIEKLTVDWAPLELAFNGTVALDEQLRPLGAGTADIRGLTDLIDKLVDRGDIKRSEATITKLGLALLTRPAKDGGAAVVRLPITAQDGVLRAGPLALGRLKQLPFE